MVVEAISPFLTKAPAVNGSVVRKLTTASLSSFSLWIKLVTPADTRVSEDESRAAAVHLTLMSASALSLTMMYLIFLPDASHQVSSALMT